MKNGEKKISMLDKRDIVFVVVFAFLTFCVLEGARLLAEV